MGIYTGTRAGAICSAVLDQPTIGRSWIDLDTRYLLSAGDRAAQNEKAADAGPAASPAACASATLEAQAPVSALRDRMEWAPVKRINKAFRSVRRAAGLARRSSRIRYGIPVRRGWRSGACRRGRQRAFWYDRADFIDVYGHHHPDHQKNAVNAFGSPRQFPDRYNETKREQSGSNVLRTAGKH